MNREPREEAARLSRRQSDLLAPDLDLQRTEQADPHSAERNTPLAPRRLAGLTGD